MTNATIKTAQILEASVLGTIAFNNGMKRVPAYDRNLDKFFGGKIGETKKGEASAIQIMKAWLKSWDAANLSQNVA